MFKCSICEYSFDSGSPHLEDMAPGAVELHYDDTRGVYHCSHCAAAIQENLQDITPYEDEYVTLDDYLRDYIPFEGNVEEPQYENEGEEDDEE